LEKGFHLNWRARFIASVWKSARAMWGKKNWQFKKHRKIYDDHQCVVKLIEKKTGELLTCWVWS